MTAPSLASRVDAILGQAETVAAFTVGVTCRECGGPFTVTRTRTTTQASEAHLSCAHCGTTAVATVTLTTPTGGHADVDRPRLPMAPLQRLLAGSVTDTAERLGITRTTFYRYRRDGIPADEADRLAIAAGSTPYNVWGRSYDIAAGADGEAVA